MLFVDEMERGINIMLHPGKETQTYMNVGAAFAYYYKLSVVPFILSVILMAASVAVISAHSPFSIFSGLFAGLGLLVAILAPILMLWIIIPVSIFVNAGLYHIFGRLFKQFKSDFSHTMVAVMYGEIPVVLFFWLILIPILGTIVEIIMGIWGFVVLVIALSRQQKISAFASFGVIILTGIIVGVIVGLIMAVFLIGAFNIITTSHLNTTNMTGIAVPAAGTAVPSSSYINPHLTALNYSQCNGFVLSTSKFGSVISGICNWTGGTLDVYAGGGNSGWAKVTIMGLSDGKIYFSKSIPSWQMAYYGNVNLPQQNYIVILHTGNGGGSSGNAAVVLNTTP